MKITIDPFDPSSISRALEMVTRYEKEFARKEEEFVRRLVEIGVSVATVGFSLADYDGEKDVLIAKTQNGSRAAVIAYGSTVGFIEFGTGVRYPEYDASTTEFKPPAHGTYGKGKGANEKGWFFTPNEGVAGRHTYGNPPAEVMLTARDKMVEQVAQIAREVWK